MPHHLDLSRLLAAGFLLAAGGCLPVTHGAALECEVCHAIVHQTLERVSVPKTLVEFYHAMDGICDQRFMRIYGLVPPKMAAGCQVVRSRKIITTEGRKEIKNKSKLTAIS